jgi:amino acid transporter
MHSLLSLTAGVTKRQVQPGWNIPLRAVFLSFIIASLMSLINIGSAVALNAINSLTISALLSSYMITIGCLLARRLRGEKLPFGRWVCCI